MIISHKFKFIFVKTAKTAGTSIEKFLSPICGPSDVLTPFSSPEEGHCPRNYKGWFNPIPELIKRMVVNNGILGAGWRATVRDLVVGRRFYHHIPAWMIKERIPRAIWNNYFKFCVVRNPLDTIISSWHWYQAKYSVQLSMDDYLAFCARRIYARGPGVGICPFNIVNYTDPQSGKILVDCIIRYENLDKELNSVFKKLGVPFEPPLQVRAKSGFSKNKGQYQTIFTGKQIQLIRKLFAEEIALHGYVLSFD